MAILTQVPAALEREKMLELVVGKEPELPKIHSIEVYPYPDLKRLWVRIELTPSDVRPVLDLEIFGPDGQLVSDMLIVETAEYQFSVTMHLRRPPQEGEKYFLRGTLIHDKEEIDRFERTFDLLFVDI